MLFTEFGACNSKQVLFNIFLNINWTFDFEDFMRHILCFSLFLFQIHFAIISSHRLS